MSILNWKTYPSGMQVAHGNYYAYSISRMGDSGYWTLGRTHADDGIMITLSNKCACPEDAYTIAETDYDLILDQQATQAPGTP
jgi:hypothetical protein